MLRKNVVIMVTGGMDSTTLMYWAKQLQGFATEPFQKINLISFDYGQAAFPKQIEMIKFHQETLKLDPVFPIEIKTHPWQAAADNLLTGEAPDENDPLGEWDQLRYQNSFIEGRNTVMVAYALAYASAIGAHELWAGYLYSDKEWENRRTYKLMTGDNSPQFVDGMNMMSQMGFTNQVRFRAPWYEQGFDKKDLHRIGINMFGIDYSKTYSCYYPKACGKCDNCLLRQEILGEEYNV